MKKSKSEETSRLLKKDPIAPYYSTHNVREGSSAYNKPLKPGGDDADPFNPETSASRQGSIKSSYVTLTENSEGGEFNGSTKDVETQTLKDTTVPPSNPPINHSIIGIGLTLICAVANSCASFIVKYLSSSKENPDQNIPPSNCLFWRGPLLILISTVWLIYVCSSSTDRTQMKEVLWPPKVKDRVKVIGILILSRVIFGPISIVTQFYSLNHIELGDSNTVVFSAAVFVPIFAYCFLHEGWGIVPFFSALLTAVGVMIISKPDFITGVEEKPGEKRYLGFIYALIAMVCNIGVYITLRYLHEVPGVILVWIMPVCSTISGIILSFFSGGFVRPKDFTQIGSIAALMIVTVIGQFALVWALRYEDASMVSLIRCSELVFGFLWQVYWEIYPDAFSGGGASLVLVSFAIAIFRKYLQQLPYEHPWRRYFKYVLK